ncbi:MAG: HEAT repeat domain-containing protein [Gemmatimonadaceae bacterium]
MSLFYVALAVEAVLLIVIVALVVLYRVLRVRRDRMARLVEVRTASGLRAWLLEGQGAEAYTTALSGIPPHIALHRLATAMTEHIPLEHRDELVVLLRDAQWTATIGRQAASRFWWRRLAAARVLAFTASPSDSARVRRLLDDPHPAVRTAATRCLPRVDDPELVALVLDRLPPLAPLVRAALTVTLRDLASHTVPALLARLKDAASPRELETWINVAEVIGAPEVYPHLAALSCHDDAAVRLAVARALKRQFHGDASDLLATLLGDGDWRVRAQAARSLGALGAHEKTPALATALADPAWWVRFRASLALAQMGEPGRRVLKESRRASDRMARDMSSLVCGLSDGSIVELTEA